MSDEDEKEDVSVKPQTGVRSDWNGYMRDYRARKKAQAASEKAELERLRRLAAEKGE